MKEPKMWGRQSFLFLVWWDFRDKTWPWPLVGSLRRGHIHWYSSYLLWWKDFDSEFCQKSRQTWELPCIFWSPGGSGRYWSFLTLVFLWLKSACHFLLVVVVDLELCSESGSGCHFLLSRVGMRSTTLSITCGGGDNLLAFILVILDDHPFEIDYILLSRAFWR